MFLTYWLTAVRYFKKNKLYAAINIAGLSIGLATCLLIIIYIRHELRYDTFHENAGRIVRATMEYRMEGTTNLVATTGTKLGPQAQRIFPAVNAYTRTYLSKAIIKVGDNVFEEPGILYADKDFFSIFSFKLIEGNVSNALGSRENIVLTEQTARKFFGSINVIGNTLQIGEKLYKVGGVCSNPPQYSQIKFGLVTDFMNLGEEATAEQWWTANWVTYLMLAPGTDLKSFGQQLNAYMKTPEVRKEARLEGDNYLQYNLEPLTSVHLQSALAGLEPNGNIRYLYMFGMVALLILIIAGANYTNLATAQSAGRAAEMGMRKAIGATRRHLFWQFMGESAIIVLISGIIAVFIAWTALPALNAITFRQFMLPDLFEPVPLICLVVLLIVISFLSGAYPAVFISGMKALQVMKRSFKMSAGNLVVRKSLIIIQFGISVFLIIYTLVMVQQMNYMQQKNLGYQKEQILVLPLDSKMHEQLELLKTSLLAVPGVASVSACYETPEFVQWGDGVTAYDENGKHNVNVNAMPVDVGFLSTMGMQLIAGHDFRKSDLFVSDSQNRENVSSNAFILNETLARKIGWTPEEAIGKMISKNEDGRVVGVVKDFHFQSLHSEVTPMLMFLEPKFGRQLVVRLDATDMGRLMKQMESWWKQRVMHRPFSYRFLDESYAKLYESEKSSSLLFISVSFLAILLACLGLFGLASYVVMQRTREIGIRMVLGAGTTGIIWMVAKQFLGLVGIGIIFALPAGWFLGNQWLNDFAYRVSPDFWLFALAALVALAIALFTISVQTVMATQKSPVKSLRTE